MSANADVMYGVRGLGLCEHPYHLFQALLMHYFRTTLRSTERLEERCEEMDACPTSGPDSGEDTPYSCLNWAHVYHCPCICLLDPYEYLGYHTEY